MSFSSGCWCGNRALIPFSPGYLKCPTCETLIAVQMQEKWVAQPALQENHFYGREYWFSHQKEDLQQPDIIQRARQDLPERCLHWLSTILKYKLPPGNLLELGSAHGGFVALLRWAGFQTAGLELSPWIAEFAKKTFSVPMLLGTIEHQKLDPHSLDMIILMDVLEHLPNPIGTMTHCLHLLKPDGILVIQTPCFPEGKAYSDLVAQKDHFLEMLIEKEHLFLFSQSSIREFFHRLGANHLEFEPAFFSYYDMFLVVSRRPLFLYLPREIEKVLSSSPGGRIVQALLDLYAQQQQLAKKYAESELDRAARLEMINRLNRQLMESEAHLEALRSTWAYRILHKIGLWNRKEKRLLQTFSFGHLEDGKIIAKSPQAAALAEVKLSRIIVDLTPLLPGGENGGAKLLAMSLVRYLSRILPDCEFVLFTSDQNHEELAVLDSANVRRQCMIHQRSPLSGFPAGRSLAWERLRLRFQEKLAIILPAPLFAKVKSFYRSIHYRTRPRGVLQEMGADLLFCPFTMPFFFDPNIPVVSIIYDMQFHHYPQFFTFQDRFNRERHFKETCRLADKLICISDFVRETVLKNSDLPPERVVSIPIKLGDRLQKIKPEIALSILQKYGIKGKEYLLYPANFWPHKNHQMLFTAFGQYRARHPESKFHLVCTGAADEQMKGLQESCKLMGLEQWISFLGYLPEEEFAAVLASCWAMIFPSLYEGFGMPILEAMVFGKPVLCSNVTSLPEVAGDAALYFDPKKPKDMLSAIERITTDLELVSHLIQRGYQRVATFIGGERMAQEYLQVFQEVRGGSHPFHETLHGLYPDGWTKDRLLVTYGLSPDQRLLEIHFEVPRLLPYKRVFIKVSDGKTQSRPYMIKRGKAKIIRHPLSKQEGIVEFLFEPSFQPKAYGLNDDERWLGCLCRGCSIITGTKQRNLMITAEEIFS